MYTRAFHIPQLGTVLVRPLRNGDAATVAAVFDRLGPGSRTSRFHGPKPRLTSSDLEALAAVDGTRHVLVAWVEGDAEPVALARLVRAGDAAEIAFEVADAYQRRGLGSALVRLLLADARAAGIRRVDAVVESRNRAALGLLGSVLERRTSRLDAGGELCVSAPL